jgi:hypothetical protein
MYETIRKKLEKTLSKRTIATVGGLALVTAGLSGCAGQETEVDYTIGVNCPDNSKIKILEASQTSFEEYNVDITCLDESGKKLAPQSIGLLKGPGTVINDSTTDDYTPVKINATYNKGGFFGSQYPEVAWTTEMKEAPGVGTVNIKDIEKLNEVTAVK